MKLKFKDILPSPYRDLIKNPMKEATIQRLMSSVNKTGFWDNVVVRKNKAGKYEMAYGHHRVEAAKRLGLVEADFIVREFDNPKMLKVKHKENDPAYGFSAPAMLESVRGVVGLLAKGEIGPFVIPEKTKRIHIRYAPSFVAGKDDGGSPPMMAYTALNVADFLDETEANGDTRKANAAVRAALDALSLIETQELSEASLKNLPLDGGRNNNGLIQKVTSSVAVRASRLTLLAAQEKLSAADADRHVAEQAEKDRQAELQRREVEAHKAEDDKAAKEWAEQQRVAAERAAARLAEFRIKRAGLDAKVQEHKERLEEAKKVDVGRSTRHAVGTMLYKLKTIVSESNAFREEIKALARDKAVTQAERENLRQAFLAAGEWYTDQAITFRPTIKVDVLKEARNKEAAKHKRESAQ